MNWPVSLHSRFALLDSVAVVALWRGPNALAAEGLREAGAAGWPRPEIARGYM